MTRLAARRIPRTPTSRRASTPLSSATSAPPLIDVNLVTGAAYTQNFGSMGATGATAPNGWFVGTGTGAISGKTVTPGDGSSNTGGNYNFGASGSSNRALGSLASASA